MKKFQLAAMVALILSQCIAIELLAQVQYQPQVGKPHPDFVFPNVNDQKLVALSDFRGKKVILVHFASW